MNYENYPKYEKIFKKRIHKIITCKVCKINKIKIKKGMSENIICGPCFYEGVKYE